ncbi:hypothetical protein BJP40_03925 [Streptomyces sp. CC53]|uniref:hypothetical protein n=1 Tax=Streptomyces sp. CC53 TaxID=1906740 RepID=UPI0008DD99A9|nr:hypothetical protein [Streptomyces sp. CC53]OII62157.1 hypothetical protein BJP40_03925 [Streptomyces sp. CC53]
MPYPVSTSLAERIEALYGRPRADLEAHAATTDRPTMLAALLDACCTVELAEKNIEFQRERLLQLADLGCDIGPATAGHLLDCSRRIAESVAIRDTQARHATAVIQSLHRAPAPAATPVSPAPAAATVRAAHAR